MFFFDESDLHEVDNVADDGAAVHAPLVGDRLVPGKALVGLAVAEGEQGGIGCPDRAGQNGHVLIGDLFEPDPVVFFALAGFGFGGVAVAAGCAHGIITFPSTPAVCYSLWTYLAGVQPGGVSMALKLFGCQPFELQGRIFSALFSHLNHRLRVTYWQAVS